MSEIRDSVELIAKSTRELRVGRRDAEGFAYASMYDFVSQHGVDYDEVGDRARYPDGTPRACFYNAAVAAVCYPGLRYVEGFAWNYVTVGFLVHHAWNIDADGRVVDTTWDNGLAYFGVEFPIEAVTAALERGAGCVLDDWRHDFPILHKPWKGAA